MSTTLAEAFPAGEYLADELAERGWTQAEFAEILGRPPQFISEIIAGKKEITRDSAAQIGAALGTGAQMWLNLQDSYYLWKQQKNSSTQAELNEVRMRARLQEIAPVAVLRKRGVITASSTQGQADEVASLFKMNSVFDTPELAMVARRANQEEDVSSTQMTWLACAYKEAERSSVTPYDEDMFRELVEGLSRQVRDPAAFLELPKAFAKAGVLLLYIEAFPASKIDGASFLIETTPVIVLSGRGQRLDKVLFTLLHESAHVLLGHVGNRGLVVDNAGDSHAAGDERAADELAVQWILPKGLPTVPQKIGQGWVVAVAEERAVHPIVIIGHLQKTGALTWRTALVRGAPSVTPYLSAW